MGLKLTDRTLRRLLALNQLPLPTQEMVFFGLRSVLPVDNDTPAFVKEAMLEVTEVDHVHPRCTLGQWLPSQKKIAVFPGSTVPHLSYIRPAKAQGGVGANQLVTGLYGDYRKGVHKPESASAHEAFRQTKGRPIRRSADDFDFDNDDRVEFDNPFDNLHAAWCMGVNHDRFASAGCQVVIGYPRCASRGGAPDTGPWKTFKDNAYALAQDRFAYLLLNGREVQAVAANPAAKVSARLRYGSQGQLVKAVQSVLRERGFYEGILDGGFGDRTLRAVLKFQSAQFGPSADDGIVGPVTASALGVAWPKL